MHTVQDGHHTSEAASRQKATKVNTYLQLLFVHFQFSFMALQDLPVTNNKNEIITRMYHFKI